MVGGKPILINLKATSPDGEVRFFEVLRMLRENLDLVSAELEELTTMVEIESVNMN